MEARMEKKNKYGKMVSKKKKTVSISNSIDEDAVNMDEDLTERIRLLHLKVFQNDLIREKIIQYVLFPSSDKKITNRQDIGNLRLVESSWLNSVDRILSKANEPLFQANLREGAPPNSFNEFNDLVSCALPYAPSKLPTFSVQLAPEFFSQTNYQNFRKCFVGIGNGLVELKLRFPVNCSIQLLFPPFALPRLKKFVVYYTNHRLIDTNFPRQFQRADNSLYAIQTILNATSILTDLAIKSSTQETRIPFFVHHLTLPATLTCVDLDFAMTTQQIQVLLDNHLPCLSSLGLAGFVHPPNEGPPPVFQILKKYGKALRTLILRGCITESQHEHPNLLRLPVMEKLSNLNVLCYSWELEGEHETPRNISLKLPALKELSLRNQRKGVFNRWLTGSVYTSVQKLNISLIKQDPTRSVITGQFLSLNRERIQAVNHSFPNITCLQVTICMSNTNGLDYLFKQMRRLRKLVIEVTGDTKDVARRFPWDALLNGMPAQMSKLSSNPEDETKPNPSICNMTDLVALGLLDQCEPSPTPRTKTYSFVSGRTFQLTLMKMEKLRSLCLTGRFQVCEKLRTKWKNAKGTDILDNRDDLL